MILDPRRRIRDRLLIGMVAVALLPLAIFALLAVIDLDSIGRSTAEAAQGAILQDEQRRQQATVANRGAVLDTFLVGVDSDLLQLRQAVEGPLAAATAAHLPPLQTVGAACWAGTPATEDEVLPCNAPAADTHLLAAGQTVLARMQAIHRDHPELADVWLANQDDTTMLTVPGFNVTSALAAGRLDPPDPSDAYRGAVLRAAQARYQHEPSWTDPATQDSWQGGPFWTDPYPLIGSGTSGVTVWIPVPGTQAMVGADMTLSSLVSGGLVPSATAPLPPGSYPLLLSSDGTVLYAGPGATLDLGASGDLAGSPLPAAATSPLAVALHHIETTGAAGGAPFPVSLAGVTKDVFTAPVYSGRWVLVRPVPLSDLQPDLAGLTAGVTSGVHHLFPLVVLPALVLLLLLAFLTATVLSRRMVGPVRQLTVAAERLARGETGVPVPPQGSDELGVLAAALERMRLDVNLSRETILAAASELEGRVAERTQELRTRNDELVALNDLAASLTRSLEPAVILGDALAAIRAIHPLSGARGYVLERAELTMAAAAPADPTLQPPIDAELDASAALAVHRRRPTRRRSRSERVLAWPLVTRQGVVGAVALRTPTMPPPATRRLLQAVADQVALAIHTSLLSATGREHAVLEERTRLAREIHDTIAQQLTGIVIQLEAAQTLVQRGSGQAQDSVDTARELARAALQEARRSVWNLRPAPLAATGLVAALEREVRAWESRSGIHAAFRARSVPARPALQPAAEVALLRTLQEALSNVARHSHAASVSVVLRGDRDEIVLAVHDDGAGFDPGAAPPRPDCFGLEGMRQRVRGAGGSLAVVSSPGHGTEITARFSLAEQVAHTA